MSIIIDGKIPFYDRALGQWVVKDEKSNDSGEKEKIEAEEKIEQQISNTTPSVDMNDSDLPF